jgi:hypothetical protein
MKYLFCLLLLPALAMAQTPPLAGTVDPVPSGRTYTATVTMPNAYPDSLTVTVSIHKSPTDYTALKTGPAVRVGVRKYFYSLPDSQNTLPAPATYYVRVGALLPGGAKTVLAYYLPVFKDTP